MALLIAVLAAPAQAWDRPDVMPYREVTAPPPGTDVQGAMLVVHGGGWVGSPDYVAYERPTAAWFARQGWLVWNVDYRSGNAAIGDVRMWHHRLDRRFDGPTCAWGRSAGGHLALMLAALEGLDCAISEGGATDLTRLGSVLEGFPVPADAWRRSPLRLARQRAEAFRGVEIVLGHAAADAVIPVRPVRQFAAALPRRTELHVLAEGGSHFAHAQVDERQLEALRAAERRLLARATSR